MPRLCIAGRRLPTGLCGTIASRPAPGAAIQRLGLEIRTGLHVGEVEMRGEEVSGLAVHTAARVMAEAGDGEILVSDAFREAVAATGVPLADRGQHQLKGVPGVWQLYAVSQAEPSD
jgi:class 3 adenylate cyclase